MSRAQQVSKGDATKVVRLLVREKAMAYPERFAYSQFNFVLEGLQNPELEEEIWAAIARDHANMRFLRRLGYCMASIVIFLLGYSTGKNGWFGLVFLLLLVTVPTICLVIRDWLQKWWQQRRFRQGHS